MSKNSLAKYYHKNNKRLQKKAQKRYQNLSKKKKKKNNMVINVTKIFQNMKNKSLLSIEKNIIELEKMLHDF